MDDNTAKNYPSSIFPACYPVNLLNAIFVNLILKDFYSFHTLFFSIDFWRSLRTPYWKLLLTAEHSSVVVVAVVVVVVVAKFSQILFPVDPEAWNELEAWH